MMRSARPVLLRPVENYLNTSTVSWSRPVFQLFYGTAGNVCSRSLATGGGESAAATQTETVPRSFSEVPGPKGPALWPIIGSALLFKPFAPYPWTRLDLAFIDLHHKYGKIVHIRLPFGHTVLLSDTRDMLTVFQNEGKYPARQNFDIITTYFKSRNVKTLSTMNGEEWHHLRMRVQPKFTRPAAANPYIPVIGLVADDLVTRIRNSKLDSDGDIRDEIFLYILESLGQFCFNRRLGALTTGEEGHASEIARRVKDLFKILGAPPQIPLYKLWKTKEYKTVEENMDYLIGLSRSELARALQEIKEDKRDKNIPHFIESLLVGSDLTEEEVAMSVSEFFFGGTDTTSRMLGLLVYHIARYPEQQKILYEEIREVVGQGQVTKEHLDRMSFTKACLKESFRLVPPLAVGPPRFLPYDLVLAGYKVPKGTLVMLNNCAYLHDPECVENPEQFRPQRWLRGADRKKNEEIPPIAFMPFGMGARICLGKRFAEQMMYLGLIKLVQNFELSLKGDPSAIGIKYEVFPTTDKPLQIKFTPRAA